MTVTMSIVAKGKRNRRLSKPGPYFRPSPYIGPVLGALLACTAISLA